MCLPRSRSSRCNIGDERNEGYSGNRVSRGGLGDTGVGQQSYHIGLGLGLGEVSVRGMAANNGNGVYGLKNLEMAVKLRSTGLQ